MLSLENGALERDMLSFRPPTLQTIDLFTSIYRAVTSPVFIGMERIPHGGGPLLFVSNHTIMGLEFPLLMHQLYKEK
jgi:hypothetical protein